ncbi:MAG: phosphoribosyltransferase [Candidatus Aenigmarchaeota archaeon]|nr:phosphoribosyltransferase [Candidatus Aenigmarchaeota archaeon]
MTVDCKPTIVAIDDPRVNYFVVKLGPKILSRIGGYPACVAPIGDGGKFFALKLYAYLTQEGSDVTYVEIRKGEGIPEYRLNDVRGRKLVIVDDAVYTATTFRRDVEPLKQRERMDTLGLIEVLFAVEHDTRNLADMAANRENEETKGPQDQGAKNP